MTSRIDFSDLKERLRIRAREIVPRWLPGGKIVGHEYEVGSLAGGKGRSLKVNLTQGVWKDFATNDTGGDLIALYAALNGNLPQAEAARRLVEEFGGPVESKDYSGSTRPPTVPPEPLIHPPLDCPAPTMVHKIYGNPSAYWVYRNSDGAHLMYVSRHEPRTPDDKKQYVPWTWSARGWIPKGPPAPTPLYGLEHLAARPAAPVLVVEGEKSAEAARNLAPHYVVVTWSGGSSAWKKANWSALHGRAIVIWPDADSVTHPKTQELLPYEEQPGTRAAFGVAEILLPIAKEVKILDVSDHGGGWDAADCTWTSPEFYAWAKSRARLITVPAPVDSPLEPAPPVITDDDPRSPEPSAYALLAEFKDLTGNKIKTPLATIENVQILLDKLGISVRYNVISKEQERLVPGKAFSIDNQRNATLTHILSWASRLKMPTALVPEIIAYIADQTPYNPVTTWIDSKPWDEKSRLDEFYATIKAKGESHDPRITQLKETFMTRWMISAVAAAYSANGIAAQGVLVLQGPQAIGKTQWFKRLVPPELSYLRADGMLLRPDDRDSIKQAVSFWLVELGELDATFRKADIAQLKAFITRSKDVFRRPYAREESEFARRTIFMASVNPKEFLHDPTGNRRFWTIECEDINYNHDLDMQQVWAEFAQLYRMKVPYMLQPEELEWLADHNERFMTRDAVEDVIATQLSWTAPASDWRWKTAVDVLRELGFEKPGHSEKTRAGRELVRRSGREPRPLHGYQQYLTPPRLSAHQRAVAGIADAD